MDAAGNLYLTAGARMHRIGASTGEMAIAGSAPLGCSKSVAVGRAGTVFVVVAPHEPDSCDR